MTDVDDSPDQPTNTDTLDDGELPRLTRCPECTYELTGLPAEHCCPECGFEFNADTVAFEGRRPRGVVLPIVAGVATLWLGTATVIGVARGHIPDPLSTVLWCLIVGAWWHWWRRRAPHYVLLTREALEYRHGGRVTESWPWDVVGYAEHSTLGRCLYVYDRDGRRIGEIPYVGQENAARAAAICEWISYRAAWCRS